MIIKRPWAFWRRLQYGTVYGIIVIAFLIGGYYNYLYAPPNCFDGVRNGGEQGVDCGGSCTRICSFTVSTPVVVWAKSFLVTEGQYNAVAYIENRNAIAGTPQVRYTFRLLDSQGVITERQGVTELPANSTFPIFEGRIDTGGRVPSETILVLEDIDLWIPSSYNRGQFRTVSTELLGINARPRLNTVVENTEVFDAQNVSVVAVIFDSFGTPLTASQTFVDTLAGRSRSDVVFTWPRPIATTIRSCDVPSDVMIVLDRSGSMAADGGDPPEPLESAKLAAAQFVSLLRERDQVGYFSYATVPSDPIEKILTPQLAEARDAILQTKMGTDGVQFTNMGEAFKVAQAELLSTRARDNARKVIVFLTDGDVTRPLNPETGQRDIVYAANYARQAAEEAKQNEIVVYTIGFGDFFANISDAIDRDVTLIADLASSPQQSFLAPTIQQLTAVYREIAEDICEAGPSRIDIIPRSGATFAPYP
jgi:Mg-chelatase subunit ChlD